VIAAASRAMGVETLKTVAYNARGFDFRVITLAEIGAWSGGRRTDRPRVHLRHGCCPLVQGV
jgi:hypothetical protein